MNTPRCWPDSPPKDTPIPNPSVKLCKVITMIINMTRLASEPVMPEILRCSWVSRKDFVE